MKTNERHSGRRILPPDSPAVPADHLLTSCSLACPHCGNPIVWHEDGEVLHGHCPACTRTLLGRRSDEGCIEATYLPTEDIYLGMRGC